MEGTTTIVEIPSMKFNQMVDAYIQEFNRYHLAQSDG
jgi:hypothetical protein